MIDRSGVRIVINFADEPRSIPLGGPAGPVLLATTAIDGPVDAGGERLTLPPKAAVVIGPAS